MTEGLRYPQMGILSASRLGRRFFRKVVFPEWTSPASTRIMKS
jgi:hypothetical protein